MRPTDTRLLPGILTVIDTCIFSWVELGLRILSDVDANSLKISASVLSAIALACKHRMIHTVRRLPTDLLILALDPWTSRLCRYVHETLKNSPPVP